MIVKATVLLTEGWKLTFAKDYFHIEIQCISLNISVSQPNVYNQCLVHIVLLYNLVYMVFCD